MQHCAGVATGVLLYKAVRRSGASPYLGLLPAAVVFFGGTGLMVEHALLSDSLFVAFQALGLYAAVRALGERGLRWPLLAGVAVGLSFWLRTVGVGGVVLVPLLLVFGAPGGLRHRLVSVGTAAAVGLAVMGGYVLAQGYTTGFWGYERQGAWNLYGRVATFVDCSRFTPPPGTAFLCPAEPLSSRRDQSFFQYNKHSPAVARYGPPAGASPAGERGASAFSVAVIEQQPGAYLGRSRVASRSSSPTRSGKGIRRRGCAKSCLTAGAGTRHPAISAYYSHVREGRVSAGFGALAFYEEHTRMGGALLVVLLVLAVGGMPLLRGRTRWAAALFTSTAALNALLVVAGNRYDVRYAYPDFGVLAAGAAFGAGGSRVASRACGHGA